MNNVTVKFLKSIGITDESYDLEIISLKRSTVDHNCFLFNFSKEQFWTYKEFCEFNLACEKITNYQYEFSFIYKEKNYTEKLISLIKDFYFNELKSEAKFDIGVNDKVLNFIFYNLDDFDEFNKKNKDLQSFLNFLSINFKIKGIVNVKEETKKVTQEEIDETVSKHEQEFLEFKEKDEERIQKEILENLKNMEEERMHQNAFKRGNYAYFKIGELDSNSGAVDVNGEIFSLSSYETKKGEISLTIGIMDGREAINVRVYSSPKGVSKEFLLSLKVKNNIRVKGRIDLNNRKEIYILGHYVFLLPDTPLRSDNFPGKKRVELHLHTNMSELDGVSNIEEYLTLAKNMGHKALGLTDHGAVQSYPDAQNLSKKMGIKMLYGCEIYLANDDLNLVLNPDETKFNDATYVIFDLESTGLLVRKDRITEFGAVKIQNGFVVDRLDILVNPGVKIPELIEEKTHITNKMVENCPTIKEVLPQIIEFIKGSILVSHNAVFDNGLLNEEMIRNGFGNLKNPTIDTLALSHHFYADAAFHSLRYLSKRLDVYYDKTSAHRADYDADVLAQCFLSLQKKINDEFGKDVTLKELEFVPMKLDLLRRRNFRPYHATIYAKNQKGLKDIYKIVSTSYIDTMGILPIVPRSVLEKYRENLIVGSACFNGEVFQNSVYRDTKTMQNTIKFYDFIEIQPLSCYSILINLNQIPSEEILKEFLLDIINEAKAQNKLICATGDVHYANPDEKKYRDVYIAHKVKGGTIHPLNPESRHDMPVFDNPDQHYLSTEEMIEAFRWVNNDDDIYNFVVENPNKIADMIEECVPIPPGTFTPKIENCEEILKNMCYERAYELYGNPLPKIIEDRLEFELGVIIKNGYSVIYYIAHKLVKHANDDGYLVGSRGSVGSSLVATMSGVTEVNPLPPHYRCPHCKHVEFIEDNTVLSGFDLPHKKCPECGEEMLGDGQNIPFQTFLGFHGEKTPDIDLNFPTDYQATAHEYTKVLLGEKNVFRAGTIMTVKDKMAYGYAREYYSDFLKIDPNTVPSAKLSSLAAGCVEVKRTTGQHPGGIVVIPNENEVYDFTPVQYPAGDFDASWLTTHFTYNSMHETILKLDMLGHVDPQAIRMMVDLTHFDYKKIPLNDEKAISLFYSDDVLNLQHKYMQKDNGALGIPEFGTNFVRQMLRETKPKTFGDLLIISGLSHGTNVWTNNSQDLIREGIVDLHGVIGCRDDVMSYLIGKGLDSADAFEIMETVRKKGKFLSSTQIEKMLEKNVPQYYIDSCQKIEYLFPKGHACAYVTMGVRVAYYKVYFPLEYYATFFTLRCEKYDIAVMKEGIDAIHQALVEYDRRRTSHNVNEELSNKEEEIVNTLQLALEMCERGFGFTNIDIERSDATKFTIDYENKKLIPPFKVLDGLGDKVAQSIIEARKERPFLSKEDLLSRAKISSTNLKLLEDLGALNNLSESNQMSLFDFF